MLLTYQKVTQNIIEKLSVVVFLCVVVFQAVNIFLRYTRVWDSLFWVDEFTRYAFIWISFLIWPLCDRKGRHFVVDVFISRIPGKAHAFLKILIHFMAITFAGIVIYAAWLYIPVTMRYHTDSFPWLKMGVVYLVIPLGLFVTIIERIILVVSDVKTVSTCAKKGMTNGNN